MDKEFLKKCWQDKRWHSLMVLIIWIVVLAILMGVVSLINTFSTKKETSNYINNQNQIEESSYFDKFENLINEDYDFCYTITKENEIIKYEGTKIKGNISGYRQNQYGIIKYTIENGIPYEILVDSKQELPTIYENVEASLLNINYIYEIIKKVEDKDIIITEEEEFTIYDYNIENGNIKILVQEDTLQINQIMIEKLNELYKLTFSLINKNA